MRWRCGIPKRADPRRAREGFLKYFELFGHEFGEQHGHPGNVSARAGLACHVSSTDRIGMDGEYNGYRFGRLSSSLDHGRRLREDNVNIDADELGREACELVDILCPSKLQDDVLAVDVAELPQSAAQGLQPARLGRRRGKTKEADARDRRLLRPRRQRPRCSSRAADQRDELATPDHSITSSARASSVGGISRPSTFAVLRLITNSYLVGACSGKSAGFSPLRMRST